jgi:hypothetical protein
VQSTPIHPGSPPTVRVMVLSNVRLYREGLTRLLAGQDGLTALKTITLDDVRRQVTGDEKWMNFLWRSFFVRPAVTAAFEQAS